MQPWYLLALIENGIIDSIAVAMELIKKFEHNCLSEKMDGRRMDLRSIAEVTETWTDEVFLDDEV